MSDFEKRLKKAKEEALSKIEFEATKKLLSTPRYDFATDDYERWLFVTDKNTQTEIVIFVPMEGDNVVEKVTLLPDNKGFCAEGWMGEACYTFQACFDELGKYGDIKLLA